MSRDQNASLYSETHINVAIQRGSAASILATFPPAAILNPFFIYPF